MATQAKLTWFMSAQAKPASGWSETLYTNAPNMAQAITWANNIATLRLLMLSDQARLDYVRASDLSNPRHVLTADYSGQPQALNGWPGAKPDNCLLVRMRAADGTHRPMFVRDIPTSYATDDTDFSSTQAFADALSNWRNAIIQNVSPFQIQSLDPANIWQAIEAFVPHTDQSIKVTQTAHGYVAGQPNTIQIRNVRTLPEFNGRWPITVLDADHYLLKNSLMPTQVATLVNEGSSRLIAYVYHDITDVAVERVTRRASGRVFFQRRGRRRAQRSIVHTPSVT